MNFRKALLAATMLTVPAIASAQPVTGLYLGAGAGANWVNNPERWNLDGQTNAGNLLGFPVPGNVSIANAGKASFNTGWVGVLSLGWGFGNGLRAEIEGNYRSNEADKIRGLGIAPVGRVGGFQNAYGVMANVFYDFDFANFGLGQSVLQPYVGVGAGYVWNEFRNIRGVSRNPATLGAVLHSNDTGGAFAYQAIAGVAVPLTWVGVRGLSLTAEYRFMGQVNPEMDVTIRNPVNNAVIRRGTVEAEPFHHSALLGLRYALFQPPARVPVVTQQAVVAPAPEVARTYLVFFDWDRADLTGRAREIIGEAAANSRRAQTTRLEVAGHADRSGTPQYNQRLSMRRANAVAAELVRQGVNRSDIGISAFGESRPLVPTADGVREPQNRRVEIVLR